MEVATTGVEPIRVASDGLYRSVSCSLYGTEDNWSWLKILALKYGVRNIDNVLEEVNTFKRLTEYTFDQKCFTQFLGFLFVRIKLKVNNQNNGQ